MKLPDIGTDTVMGVSSWNKSHSNKNIVSSSDSSCRLDSLTVSSLAFHAHICLYTGARLKMMKLYAWNKKNWGGVVNG
jgi:hypothetical protein